MDFKNTSTETEIFIVIDLEEYIRKGERHPEHDPGIVIYYKIRVDDDFFEERRRHLEGKAILALVAKEPSSFKLFQIKHEHGHIKEVEIAPHEIVDFGTPGIERFITKAKVYPFFIGQKEYVSPKPELTVKEILEDYAKVDPAGKTLAKKNDSGFDEYKNLNEVISVRNCPHFVLFDNDPTTVS